jgi:SEC-C motif domain protein
MSLCPCRKDSGVEKLYADCCGPFITGEKIPSTPEELMRSRYTAYTQSNIDYIANTMKGRAAENFNPVSAAEWSCRVEWLRLIVEKFTTKDDTGYVEFIVYYRELGKRHGMHEISEFKRENGKWYYVDGRGPAKADKIDRNDPCICGSEIKYKKCCGVL